MKPVKTLAAAILFAALFSNTSCIVANRTAVRHDNGKHKGWYKNPNNPHNPASTKQAKPGKVAPKQKGKKK
jgi:hypothetical protein